MNDVTLMAHKRAPQQLDKAFTPLCTVSVADAQQPWQVRNVFNSVRYWKPNASKQSRQTPLHTQVLTWQCVQSLASKQTQSAPYGVLRMSRSTAACSR
jgi:hypothetical protein